MMPGGKCRIKGKFCHAWSDFDGCGLVRCKFVESAKPKHECDHEFYYSDLQNEFICRKCFHVMTGGEKRELLTFANNKRNAEEKKMRSLTEVKIPIEVDLTKATKPKTNADHIRSMADDELADFANVQIGCGSGFFPCGLVCGGQCNSFDNDTCREKILNWLKQPHEADT